MRIITLGGVLAVLALAGCASSGPTTAEREDVIERTAVVQSVDPERRRVELLTAEGRPITVIAGREVRNFSQIEPGDTVRAVFVESVAARMAEADESGPTTGVVATQQAPLGARPGAAVATEVNTVVEVISYDPATHVATFRTPEGTVHSIVVAEPMRAFAAARQPGDRVALTLTEAVAIALEETQG